MLQRENQIRMQIHQMMDACLFALAFWLAYELRASDLLVDHFTLPNIGPFENFLWFYLVLIPVAPLVLEAQGFYNRPELAPRRAILWPLFKGCFITTVGLVIAFFFFRRYPARSVVIWFGFISFLLVYLKEEVLRIAYKSKLAQTQYQRRFILIGPAEETARIRNDLTPRSHVGVTIVAELDLNNTPVEKVIQVLHDCSANGVILSVKHTYFELVENTIKACELEGVDVWLVADFFRTQISRTSFDEFHGRPVMVFSSTPEASWQSGAKLAIDFFGALFLLTISSPIFAATAIAIKLTSPGPVLFRQQRAGLNGSPFTMLKFRSMVSDAEQKQQEMVNDMHGPAFKMNNDPRITPIGKWLRRYSIDELPQLINVVKGEMSLVGPRPLPVDQVKRFDDFSHRRRLSVKPGLTCLWQVSGRAQITEFSDWVRLDLEYIDNWSLWLDFKILFRTIPAVLGGAGAK